jgi:cellulose synthase/poly-beta-1,6-N-acetylglucosamine synthase-like glycosyltransferase
MRKKYLKSGSGKNLQFTSILLTFVVLINVGYLHFLVFPSGLAALFYAWLLEIWAVGLAYELTELLFTLVLPESHISCLKELNNYPSVALLCVTCDNIDVRLLKKLNCQTYPNLQIFILDDSEQKESKYSVDSLNFNVIRRSNKKGYKAGNLNNWLCQYSLEYTYFIVADADSLFDDDFVHKMVCYAEHPDNEKMAIFETLIEPWNQENLFIHLQSVMNPLQHRCKLGMDNWFNLTLSAGHNNLYRTGVIRNIGGFNQRYIAEDHATCMELLKENKWKCKTVSVKSYERLPANFNEYLKRQVRWTLQTFQLLSFDSSGLSLNAIIAFLRTLYYHLIPFINLLAILLLIGYNFECAAYFHFRFWQLPWKIIEFYPYFMSLLFWFFCLLLPMTLRCFLAKKLDFLNGIYFCHYIFYLAISIATAWAIFRNVIEWIITSKQLQFDVTRNTLPPSLIQIIFMGLPGFILSWIALISILINPWLSGLCLVWILPYSLSPFLIYYCQNNYKK